MASTQLDARSVDGRRVSVFPRRCGPVLGATLVEEQLLASVAFSDHALQRFAERTGIAERQPAAIEETIRDLLLQEGLRVPRAPRWAHVRTAPFYLQAGDYLLFTGRPGRRAGSRSHTITTVVANGEQTWAQALAHGDIATPPPRPPEPPRPPAPGILASLARVRSPRGLLDLPRAHRAHQRSASAALVAARVAWEREGRAHQVARETARRKHLARHGFLV